MTDDPLLAELAAVVGPSNVLVDADITAGYERDWTGRFVGSCRAVIRPADTSEVAATMAACHRAGVPVVPQGGNTGLVGGGVPVDGAVVLSTRRLTSLEPVDLIRRQVVAGAGVTIAHLQAHAAAAGGAFAVDFGARDSATIGGAVATNAGGSRVVRYGTTGAQVRGVEAVLASGEVVSTIDRLPKAGAGFDPTSLLIGSEGTLAVITRVRAALVEQHPERATALLCLESLESAGALVAHLRARLASLDALELLLPGAYRTVLTHLGRPVPAEALDDARAFVLVEAAADEDPTDLLADAVAGASGIRDAAVAVDEPGRARLWALRDEMSVAIAALGVPLKLDVAMPLGVLASSWDTIQATVAELAPEALVLAFGHLAEGNLHVNIIGAGDAGEEITDRVLRHVAAGGGAISAEHGIGRAKAAWLPLMKSPSELGAMWAIKEALDPEHVLNPGTLFVSHSRNSV